MLQYGFHKNDSKLTGYKHLCKQGKKTEQPPDTKMCPECERADKEDTPTGAPGERESTPRAVNSSVLGFIPIVLDYESVSLG